MSATSIADTFPAMDKHDTDDFAITDEQRAELRRRSEAYRRNPREAIPLDEALERIERRLDELDGNPVQPQRPRSA